MRKMYLSENSRITTPARRWPCKSQSYGHASLPERSFHLVLAFLHFRIAKICLSSKNMTIKKNGKITKVQAINNRGPQCRGRPKSSGAFQVWRGISTQVGLLNMRAKASGRNVGTSLTTWARDEEDQQYATITSLQLREPAENCLFSRPMSGFYWILFKACFVFWLTGSLGMTPSQYLQTHALDSPSLPVCHQTCVHFYTNIDMKWLEISYYGILFNKITYICMIVSRIALFPV